MALLGFALVAASSANARENAADRSEIALAKLPAEARDVLLLIRAGGPFPYERTVSLGNREPPAPCAAPRLLSASKTRWKVFLKPPS